ncbi:MAG: GNAT family N-acetyltransferase [Roseinatronobacter sp.]|nr:GNAT family N-acetyltransferase [Roseinatronobacter sp.]
MTLRFESLTGASIAPVIEGVAALRIAVFREWPYLYEGDLAYERSYLRAYQDSARAVVVAAWDGATLVGASTGLPLAEADGEFAAAFAGSPLDMAAIFYCAESVLLPAYRGQGAGHRFFDLREGHARAHGFTHTAFCSVIRPDDHPARPAQYRPLDGFWRARGYAPCPGIVAQFTWRDLGESTDSPKPLQFWSRTL